MHASVAPGCESYSRAREAPNSQHRKKHMLRAYLCSIQLLNILPLLCTEASSLNTPLAPLVISASSNVISEPGDLTRELGIGFLSISESAARRRG